MSLPDPSLIKRPQALRMIGARTVPNTWWAFFGDSWTNNTLSGPIEAPVLVLAQTVFEHHYHFSRKAEGRAQFAGKFGQSGMGFFNVGDYGKTLADAKADFLAVAPRPSNVFILLGINDLSHSFADIRDAYAALIEWFLVLGCTVGIGTIGPRNDLTAGGRKLLHAINTWIMRVPFIYPTVRAIDLYGLLNDDVSGNWRGTTTTGDIGPYNRDDKHPNSAGSAIIGQAEIDGLLGPQRSAPYRCRDNGEAAVSVGAPFTVMPNGLFLTDALTGVNFGQAANDDIPDYWRQIAHPESNSTLSITDSGDEIPGNWWGIVRTDGVSGSDQYRSYPIPAVTGDIIQIGFAYKQTIVAGGMQVSVSLNARDAATPSPTQSPIWIPHRMFTTAPVSMYDTTEPEFVFEEWVVPAYDDFTPAYVGADIYIASGYGAFSIGQFTLRNLTAMGVV